MNTGARFPPADPHKNPGPFEYRIPAFTKPQADARRRTYVGKTMGEVGRRCGEPPSDASRMPGPFSYKTEKVGVDAMGGPYRNARFRSAPSCTMGTGVRCPSMLSTCSPGPGAYLIP